MKVRSTQAKARLIATAPLCRQKGIEYQLGGQFSAARDHKIAISSPYRMAGAKRLFRFLQSL